MRLLIISILLTLLGYIVLPSAFYTGDMVVHTMFIKKNLDPTLFRKDYTSNYRLTQKDSSVYYPLMSLIIKISPFTYFQSLQILHVFYLLFFFWGILTLANALTDSFIIGVVWGLFILLKFHIGGSAIETIETEFVPRGLSIVSLVWSLVAFLNKRYFWGNMLVIASIMFHILTGFYGSLFYLLFWALKKWQLRKLIRMISVLLIIVFILNILKNTKIDQEWLEIIQARNTYAFLGFWSGRAWINLLLMLVFGLVYLYRQEKNRNSLYKFLQITYCGSGILLLAHLLFVLIYPIWVVIILQLGRSLIFPVYASLLSGAVLVIHILNSNWKRYLFIGVLTVIVILFNMSRAKPELNEWIKLSAWAKSTGKDCIFLTPFSVSGFRVESERAIVGDIKDGTLSFYSRDFAVDWWQRSADLNNWENLSTENLLNLQKKYGFDYLVSANKFLELPLVYDQTDYKVYSLQTDPSCEKI